MKYIYVLFGKRFAQAGLLALAVLVSTSAGAATDTDTLNVTATVLNSCIIDSTSTVAFGTYDPIATHRSSNLDGTGTVTVSCTTGSTGNKITLGQGSHAAGGASDAVPQRQMNAGGVANLAYSLYQDASRSTVWGNTDATGVSYTGEGFAAPTPVTVYGRISAGQSVPAGNYSDTVTVTVTFTP